MHLPVPANLMSLVCTVTLYCAFSALASFGATCGGCVQGAHSVRQGGSHMQAQTYANQQLWGMQLDGMC